MDLDRNQRSRDVGQGPGNYRVLSKQKNNTFTDVSGITYTWTEGNGW